MSGCWAGMIWPTAAAVCVDAGVIFFCDFSGFCFCCFSAVSRETAVVAGKIHWSCAGFKLVRFGSCSPFSSFLVCFVDLFAFVYSHPFGAVSRETAVVAGKTHWNCAGFKLVPAWSTFHKVSYAGSIAEKEL